MELVDGANLRAWLAGRPARAAILDVMMQVGRGVAAAHAAGIVHRDLKPDNILVGSDGRARVGDFGLARAHEQVGGPGSIDRATTTGAVIGTPAYMAPEQLEGEPAGPLTDQFAYCVTLWEAVYGARPFAASTVTELREALRAPLHGSFRNYAKHAKTFEAEATKLMRAIGAGKPGDDAEAGDAFDALIRAYNGLVNMGNALYQVEDVGALKDE